MACSCCCCSAVRRLPAARYFCFVDDAFLRLDVDDDEVLVAVVVFLATLLLDAIVKIYFIE